MGLIKAALKSIDTTLSDQWEDYITCDDLSSEVLISKKTTKSGQISANSRIRVNPGQAAIIVDSGRIIDATAEEGIYTFDSSSSPTVFAGQFGQSFKEVLERIKYNGQVSKNQEVYYVNIQGEIEGNNFGSPAAISYDDPIYQTIYIRFHGTYTIKIANPLIFYNSVANDITDGKYTKSKLMTKIDSEFTGAISTAIANCAYDDQPEERRTFKALTSKQTDIAKHMNDELDESWLQNRGIEVVSVGLKSVTPDDSSKEQISKYDASRFYSKQENAAGRMVDATANAMEGAANNANGAANGFMGLGMMNMMGGNMNGGQSPVAFTAPAQQAPAAAPAAAPTVDANAAAASGKVCGNCGATVNGKFCSECGAEYVEPAPKGKFCPNCGASPAEGAKFCVECGQQL